MCVNIDLKNYSFNSVDTLLCLLFVSFIYFTSCQNLESFWPCGNIPVSVKVTQHFFSIILYQVDRSLFDILISLDTKDLLTYNGVLVYRLTVEKQLCRIDKMMKLAKTVQNNFHFLDQFVTKTRIVYVQGRIMSKAGCCSKAVSMCPKAQMFISKVSLGPMSPILSEP